MSTRTDTRPDVAAAPVVGEPTAAPGPVWLAELLELLELRRNTLLPAVGGVALAGALVALLLPRFLPPRPAVGAAVGLAAVLLGVAITLALDSLDLRIRGPRHVRSAGGLLAQQLTGTPSQRALGRLVAVLGARARAEGRVLIGLSPTDAELEAEGWQDALASALADDGLRVLTVDLQRPAETHPGVAEVADGHSTLADAVTFDEERMVARLGPGGDPAAALGGLRTVVGRLPSDIDVVVVLLPPPSGGGVLGAASALDHLYVLAEVDRTSRVDLIAALDAFDAVQATSEVLLVAPVGTDAAAAPVALEEPVVEERVAEPPAVEPPVVEEPVAEPPVVDEPVVEEPVVEEPAVDPAPAEPPPSPGPTAEAARIEPRPAPEPVIEDAPREDPQLRLMMAEAALELAGLSAFDAPSDEPESDEPEFDGPESDEPVLDEGDPTVETPPVVIDEPVADDAVVVDAAGDEPVEELLVRHPVADDPVADEPFADEPDLPEDPARVAAALRWLGHEPWSPQARVPTAPRG